MKTKMTNSDLLIILVVAVASFPASYVAAQTNNTKSMLAAAGFHVRAPQTAQQKEIYAGLPDNKIERTKVKGKDYYVLKDEKAGVFYIGRDAEHKRYEQLCAQKRVKTAAEEDGAVKWRWQTIAEMW
jgi:hypothetical protein